MFSRRRILFMLKYTGNNRKVKNIQNTHCNKLNFTCIPSSCTELEDGGNSLLAKVSTEFPTSMIMPIAQFHSVSVDANSLKTGKYLHDYQFLRKLEIHFLCDIV